MGRYHFYSGRTIGRFFHAMVHGIGSLGGGGSDAGPKQVSTLSLFLSLGAGLGLLVGLILLGAVIYGIATGDTALLARIQLWTVIAWAVFIALTPVSLQSIAQDLNRAAQKKAAKNKAGQT